VAEPTPPAGMAVSKDDSLHATVASTTIHDSEAAPNPAAGLPEDLIGVSFTGNPTVRHDGVEVASVQPNGPADRIDIKPGDVILAIDGHFLVTIEELRAELLRHTVGKPLVIRYRHGRLTSENYLILRF
jgi:S1-C subfamily serine protease